MYGEGLVKNAGTIQVLNSYKMCKLVCDYLGIQ